MAKGKYEKWLEPDGLLRLEAWARDGLTDEQIAKNMGISAKTLYEYKKKYRKICETLKKGKEIVDIQVENKLLELCLEGNITALIFWLKNRRPNRWRDRPTTDSKDTMDKLDSVLKKMAGDSNGIF